MSDDAEKFIPLGEARNYPPLSELPYRSSLSSLWRKHVDGQRTRSGEHVHLKAVRIGRRLFTKPSWIRAFFETVAVTDERALKARHASQQTHRRETTRTTLQRRRAKERAAETVERARI